MCGTQKRGRRRPAPGRSLGRSLARSALLGTSALAAGCGALPASGPEERDVLRSEREANQLGFRIVDVDARTVTVLDQQPTLAFATLASMGPAGAADAIGPGDVLQISVYEIGSGLFSASGSGAAPPQEQAGSAGISTAATRQSLPPMQVERDGTIHVPYVGRIRAAGRTPAQLEAAIEGGLRSHSQDPQVVVEIAHNVANTVIVAGEVNKPGRVPLTLARERLLDVIALAGGPTHQPQDMVVELDRRGVTGRAPLDQVQRNPEADVPMQPQDRVQVLFQPRTYTVFGAARVAETPFTAADVSLAEAIARAGGPLDERADPNAVFLFRYETPAVARQIGIAAGAVTPVAASTAGVTASAVTGVTAEAVTGVPVVYRLDLLNTNSYFLAQHFPMRNKDVIYVANARTNQVGKFFGLISALFAPAVITHSLSAGGY
jgi:polysaccharide export outer membrane protein